MTPPRTPRRLVLALLAALALAPGALADVVVLKDGRRVEGKVVRQTATEVVVQTPYAKLTFPRSDVVEIIEKKTKQEVYEEKLAACETADDFYELGRWCAENKLKRRGEEHFRRAIELEPDHEGARTALGFVRYRGEWMTPEERDRRMQDAHEAEMRARGLVPHGEGWVTPEEKAKLDQGLVLHEGRWVPADEAMRLRGFERFEGEWLPRADALAREALAGMVQAAGRSLASHRGEEALICGTLPETFMATVDKGLSVGRRWFDDTWGVEPGLKLYGDRLAEFYVFDDTALYQRTVEHLAGRSSYIPEGWVGAVKETYGFVWSDPVAISSARLGNRSNLHLEGHNYHHLGHLMLNRLGYEGKLLPAWYDEGVAALTEQRVHGINAVFCRSSVSATSGTNSGAATVDFDSRLMRDGSWRERLKEALDHGRIQPFDKLAQKEFSQLDIVDIATSMAIVEWLESRGGDTLAKLHAVFREGAPPAPLRVIRNGRDRQDFYDRAFQAAVGTGFRQADAAWRAWFLSH